jgi:hypothetical protein
MQKFVHPFPKIMVNAKCNSCAYVNNLINVKKSLTHPNINVKHQVVMCVSIYLVIGICNI